MVVSVDISDGIATVTIDNPPVNAASQTVRQGLVDAVNQIDAHDEVKAAVLICAGRTFVAGADVKEFGQAPTEPYLPDVVSEIEAARVPWVAAIHGSALGGGLEIALGCAHRIALESAKLGLPEVTLGLIPGAGGTVRLPRVVSAEAALDMVAGGKPVSATRALDIGLIDEIVSGDLTVAAKKFASALSGDRPAPILNRAPHKPKDEKAWSAQKAAIAKKARGTKSPLAAVAAVEAAFNLSSDAALAKEREAFLDLKSDPQSAALRHIFFAERSAGKSVVSKTAAPAKLETVAVIGGGTMGAGIVAACLLAGLKANLVERDHEGAAAGHKRVTKTLDGSAKRGLISAEAHAAFIEAFQSGTDDSLIAEADLVIEAVFEDMDVKKQVFQRVDSVAADYAVLATNTSYLDVDEIAQAVADPSRVIGLHFFSPAHIMKLLELVVPPDASEAALATGVVLGKHLRKITVPAGVCDGFIGNRIMSRYRRECDYIIVDGALPEEVDAAMRDFGFGMGVFEMQDMAGLDIAWAMRKRRAATRDPSERYVHIADQLCEAGRFGRKTGSGWYRYSDGTKPETDAEVTALILAESDAAGIARRSFTADDIMNRILNVMQEEGRAILDEGIAQSAADIDVVMVNGFGFPRWRGGPMYMSTLQE